ncbi:hypothetical protein [Pseudarthrobacter sp. NKDBFgelt]|uniref:hypothetical protein n=1 Tax=Pseudarthrobacter sp. NKDBFgelt TaxID=3384443 RepID=UPI0038D37513
MATTRWLSAVAFFTAAETSPTSTTVVPRRALASDRCAVVVDNDVIASAVSRAVQLSSGVAPGQVTTTVAGRSARVQVRPTSGLALDAGALTAAASSELARYGLATRITPAVRVASSGAVGQ